MKLPISIFIKRLKWNDYAYFAMTVFLGTLVVDAKHDFGKVTTWIYFVSFAIASYFSGELIYKAFRPNNAESNCLDVELESTDQEESRKYYDLGCEYLRDDKYESAIDNFTKAITITPEVSGLYIYRGGCKIFLEDCQGAICDFTKAIDLNPTDPSGYRERGRAKIKSDEYNLSEALIDIRQSAELGDKSGIELLSSVEKWRIKDWTNRLLRDKEGFDMDESSEQYMRAAYLNSEDEDNEEWIHKFLDVAVECFINSRNETREELSKTQLAKVYSDFVIYILEFPFVESRASLKIFAPNLDIDIYDRLLICLVGSELNNKWPEFYNTRLCDMHNKRGKGLTTLEAGQ